jgi:hypothetical protein
MSKRSHFSVPRTEDGRPVPDVESGTHVGVIGSRPIPTPGLQDELERILRDIRDRHPAPFVLHHGCAPGADVVAHNIVRKFGGWRIHGHPALDGTGREVRLPQSVIPGLQVVHSGKPRKERDADIVNASQVLIDVSPRPQDDLRSSQSRSHLTNQAGRAAVRETFYLKQSSLLPKPGDPKALKKQPATTTVATKKTTMKNVADAERQGGEDYKAGRQCRKYKDFLSKYGLFKSDDSLQMWA